MNLAHVLQQPVMTEKSKLNETRNRFTVRVNRWSTKAQIKTAIEKYFPVMVTRINTLIVSGKSRSQRGRRGINWLPAWKKAIVQLKAGQSLRGEEVKPKS